MGSERGQFDGIEFEWHRAKAELNAQKHGVTFLEAMTIFADEHGLMVPDHLNSENGEVC